MAKKPKTKPKEPMFISLSLPVEGQMPRKGTILVRHDSVAVLHSFEYRTMGDILRAINDAVNHELVVEADPPQIPTLSATAATATATPATPPDTAPTDEADEQVDEAETDASTAGRVDPTDEESELFDGEPDAQGDEQPDMLFEEPAEEPMPAGDPADNFVPTGEPATQASLF